MTSLILTSLIFSGSSSSLAISPIPGISVVYYDTDGNKTIRYHDKNGKISSHAWRNNNPGNLVYGDGSHAKETGVAMLLAKVSLHLLKASLYQKW